MWWRRPGAADGVGGVELTVVVEAEVGAVIEVMLAVDGGASGGDGGTDVEMMVEMMELAVVQWRCK